MISICVKRYIFKRAREYNVSVPLNYLQILDKYVHLETPIKAKIIFSQCSSNSQFLAASGTFKGVIILNAEWAARIALFDNEQTQNAFKATIGHELTHQCKEYSRISKLGLQRTFISRVNEVHADFGAAEKMLNGSRELLLQTLSLKQRLHPSTEKNQFTTAIKKKFRIYSDHPSWEQRYNYVKNNNFDKILIRKIAADIDFKNDTVIEQVAAFYDVIQLN